MAVKNLEVPWYIRQQVDIFDPKDRQPDPSNPAWFDPMSPPVFSMENILGASIIESAVTEFKNITLNSLDFRDYVKIEPDGDRTTSSYNFLSYFLINFVLYDRE